jgi:hypothetical protein
VYTRRGSFGGPTRKVPTKSSTRFVFSSKQFLPGTLKRHINISSYHLSFPVCPPEFSSLRIRQGACTGQLPLSSCTKDRAHPAARPSSSSILFQHSLAQFCVVSSYTIYPSLPRPTQNAPFVSLAIADAPGCTASLKPESSIYHSSFDAPK